MSRGLVVREAMKVLRQRNQLIAVRLCCTEGTIQVWIAHFIQGTYIPCHYRQLGPGSFNANMLNTDESLEPLSWTVALRHSASPAHRRGRRAFEIYHR